MGARTPGEQGSPRDMTTLPVQRNTAGRMRNSNNTRAGPWSLAYPRKKWHGKMATYSLYIKVLHRERCWDQAPCPDRDEAKTIPTPTLQWASCEARTISSPCPRSMPASITWWLTVPPCLLSIAPVGDGSEVALAKGLGDPDSRDQRPAEWRSGMHRLLQGGRASDAPGDGASVRVGCLPLARPAEAFAHSGHHSQE